MNATDIRLGPRPEKGSGEYWNWKRRREAINDIKRYERTYPLRKDIVLFLVSNSLKFDKIPGHKEVYREYLKGQPLTYHRDMVPSYLDILTGDMLK